MYGIYRGSVPGGLDLQEARIYRIYKKVVPSSTGNGIYKKLESTAGRHLVAV